MKCHNCSAELERVGKFCPRCGSKLEQGDPDATIKAQSPLNYNEPATDETTPVTAVEAPPVVPEYDYNTGDYGQCVEYTLTPSDDDSYSGGRRRSVGATVGIILLALCLYITSFLSLLIYDARNTVEQDNIEQIIADVDIVKTARKYKLISGNEIDRFYTMMNKYSSLEMDDKQLEKFIDRSTVRSYFAKQISNFCDDMMSGKDAEITVSAADIIKLLDKNDSYIYDLFGSYLTSGEYDNVVYWFLGEATRETIVDSRDLEDEEPELYAAVTIGFSYITLAILIVISVALIAIMLKIDLPAGVCATGVVLTIVGVIAAIIAPVIGRFALEGTLAGLVVTQVSMINIIPAIIILLVGIVTLVVRVAVVRRK